MSRRSVEHRPVQHRPVQRRPEGRRSRTRGRVGPGLAVKGRYLLLSLAVLALDQWSKWLVELHLPLHAAHPVVPGLLNLTHVRNTGVAFGFFSGGVASSLLAGLGLLALVLVAAYFAVTHSHDRWLLAALSLVMGGAVGNLLDRLAAGAVTDFVDLHLATRHWPSFNVADSAITVGIALLALDVFRARHRHAAEPRDGAERTGEIRA